MIKKIKETVLKNIQTTRFKLSSNNNPLFIGFYKYLYKPKRGSLNEFLNEYSISKKNTLSVIQIGANDGITHDPIHKFIKRDKWKGVLLEPQSYVHEQFLKKIYKRNKGIHTLCAAISEKDGKQHLYKIGFSNMRWATGLASFKKEAVESAFNSGLVQTKCLKHNIKLPLPSEYITSEEIITISPETLLNKYQISRIDLLQIDAEGFDFEVIKIFDIQKSQPNVIVFENKHLSEKDMTLCIEHLKVNNYRIKNFDDNTVAMLNPLGDFDKYF